ncbi:MAG: glycosyltransferase family 2 protein [Oscillospiraceae bacterium]|nr:glycosyltransferase family 2 protein [Oscillospiraceae bacterium]
MKKGLIKSMKARIAKKQTYNESGILLSVGMIVKNEEKHLEKCLTALKPLLDAVPSELVIADTGSTDCTVEIAKRFTDKVYHFEWVNDFSAARNFGLEKCTGEWFMFLDADEVFDDLSEMTGFFTNRAALNKYGSMTYMVRNYHDAGGTEWSTGTVSRAVKKLPGVRFHGAIHEHLLPYPAPTLSLKAFVHHYGYAFETEEQAKAKKERNLTPLCAELKKKPNDVRIRSHILADIQGGGLAEFLAETLEVTRRQQNHPYAQGIFSFNIINHYMLEKYESVLGSVAEFIKSFGRKPKNIRWLDVYAARALSLQQLGRQDEAIEALAEYLKLYSDYLAGRLAADTGNLIITYSEPSKYAELKSEYDNLLFKTGRRKMTFSDSTTIKVETSAAAVKKEEDCIDEQEWKPLLEKIKNNTAVTDTDGALLGRYMAKIAEAVLDLPYLTLAYEEKNIESNVVFGVVLYETAVKQAGRLPWNERAVLYKNFVKYAARYAADNYNPADELHRFGYYAGRGEFKEALDAVTSEHLKWAAEFLLEEKD